MTPSALLSPLSLSQEIKTVLARSFMETFPTYESVPMAVLRDEAWEKEKEQEVALVDLGTLWLAAWEHLSTNQNPDAVWRTLHIIKGNVPYLLATESSGSSPADPEVTLALRSASTRLITCLRELSTLRPSALAERLPFFSSCFAGLETVLPVPHIPELPDPLIAWDATLRMFRHDKHFVREIIHSLIESQEELLVEVTAALKCRKLDQVLEIAKTIAENSSTIASSVTDLAEDFAAKAKQAATVEGLEETPASLTDLTEALDTLRSAHDQMSLYVRHSFPDGQVEEEVVGLPKKELVAEVLIVDDESCARNTTNFLVKKTCGCTVAFSDSGEHAVSRIKSGERFHVILMDWGMGEMNGTQATQQIFSILDADGEDDFPRARIFGVTSEVDDAQIVREFTDAGASDVFGNPLSRPARHAILGAVKRSRNRLTYIEYLKS